ncbi:DNA-binding transcription factor [Aureococcus anophagefferens]|nr:DNA-binding transcription factor [Aureococcus anophagefferens]
MSELRIAAIIAQETALEAYRDAASPYGFKHRPGPGRPGYGVVSATMSYWHGVDFSKVAKTERDATLRAATHWETDRRGSPGPRAHVDREAHGRLCGVLRAVLAEELGPPPGTRVAVLWDDDVVYEGVVDDILGRARARIRFDNGDSWDATFPPSGVGDDDARAAGEAEPHEQDVPGPARRGRARGRRGGGGALTAEVDDDDGGDRPTAAKASATKRFKPCNCRNSRCLKLYCDCRGPLLRGRNEAARGREKEPAEAKLNELELAAREAAKKEPAEAKPNELELSRVLPRERVAEALSSAAGVLAASELGEAATLARNFVQNDALQAAPTGEAFFDRVLSRSGLALSPKHERPWPPRAAASSAQGAT